MQHLGTQELEQMKHDLWREIRDEMTPQERLEGLSPEERLEGLSPEELLAALTPEQRERLRAMLQQPPQGTGG